MNDQIQRAKAVARRSASRLRRRVVALRSTPGATEDPTHAEFVHHGTTVLLPQGLEGRMGRSWSKGQFYESGLLNHLYGLHLGGTYLDVGMNSGNHSLYFARVCPSQRVLSFEPYSRYRQNAGELFAVNDVREKIDVFPVALSDTTGPLELNIRGRHTTAMQMRLDDLAPTDVTVMKVDVEGFEMPVLRGARETIERWHPHLFVELFDDNFEAGAAEIISMGYTLGRRFKSPTYEFIPTHER